jgi:adhesin transport system outer membrane protein
MLLPCILRPAWSAPLGDELSQLVTDNPKLSAARQVALAEGAEVEGAKDAYYPTLSVNGNAGKDRYKDAFRTGSDYVELDKEKATIELSQNLFSGYQHRAALEESRSKHRLANFDVTKTHQELLLQGILAYLDVLHFHQMSATAEEKVALSRRYLALKQGAHRKGGGTNIEVLEARLGLQRALEKKLNTDTQFRLASSRYEEVFGHPPTPYTMSWPELYTSLIPESLEQALESFRGRNMDAVMAEERIVLARHRKNGEEARYWPRIDLKVLYDYEKNNQGVEGITRETYVHLGMKWDFNLANQTGAKLRSAQERIAAEQSTYDATLQEESHHIRQSWNKYQAMLKREELSTDTLKIANELLASRKGMRRKGIGNEATVVSATARMLTSKLAHNEARHAAQKAAYELVYAVGLLDYDNLEM